MQGRLRSTTEESLEAKGDRLFRICLTTSKVRIITETSLIMNQNGTAIRISTVAVSKHQTMLQYYITHFQGKHTALIPR